MLMAYLQGKMTASCGAPNRTLPRGDVSNAGEYWKHGL
jgi:hypothetical protein